MKIQTVPQQCHGILQTYIPSKSTSQGLSDALHVAWVHALDMKIHFKYLKSLIQHENTNSAATVPRNSTDLYTVRKCFLGAFERNNN